MVADKAEAYFIFHLSSFIFFSLYAVLYPKVTIGIPGLICGFTMRHIRAHRAEEFDL